MQKKSRWFLLLVAFLSLASCRDDLDDQMRTHSVSDTQNFVYDAMQLFYLYKSEKEVLGDDFFQSIAEREKYLSRFDSPESLFDDLLYSDDRFSIIVPDFRELENQLDGISLNNGMDYGLVRISESGEVLGYVRYVLPGTSAEEAGLQRGMLFNRIDGVKLDEHNYREILSPAHYKLGLVTYTNSRLEEGGEIELYKKEYTENPIYMDTIYTVGNQKIGYLVYNAFTQTFDQELNDVFGNFKAEHIQGLVIDLRYNGGGSVETSKNLAGMVTGQFTGKLFAKEVFNDNFSDEDLLFSNQLKGGQPLNSLNLKKVYILTTRSTASASELLINALRPYIDVIQVGDYTTGKFQGSVMLYESPDFSRSAVQPGHSYALLPLILKTVNAAGHTDYTDGLAPDIPQEEDILRLGELGRTDEPLLQHALQKMTGTAPQVSRETRAVNTFKFIGERKEGQWTYRQMIAR